MKKILFFFLLIILIFIPAYADSIKCYSQHRLVYSAQIQDLTYTGELFVFVEKRSNQIIFTNTECVAKIPNRQGESDAVIKGKEQESDQ